MPSRIIREGILDSVAINELSDDGEILYRRLMSIVDDFGRFEDKPELIRARCFALKLTDWSLTRVSQALADVSQPRADDGRTTVLVTRYEVNGKKYLQINNFGQRERHSKFPAPTIVSQPRADDGQLTDDRRPNSESESESYSESNAKAERRDPPTPLSASDWAPWTDAEAARDEILAVYPNKSDLWNARSWWANWITEAVDAPAVARSMLVAALFLAANCPAHKVQFLPSARNFLAGRWSDDWYAVIGAWTAKEGGGGKMAEAMLAIQAAGRAG